MSAMNREHRRAQFKPERTPEMSVAQIRAMETSVETIELDGERVRKAGVSAANFSNYLKRNAQYHAKTGRYREAKLACNGCHACCHQRAEVLMEMEPPERLKHLDLVPDPDALVEGGMKLRQNEDSSCVHLGEHGCTVHKYRPTICRTYDCRLNAFYGLNVEHEAGGKEPRWWFKVETDEDVILTAAIELVRQTYEQRKAAPGLPHEYYDFMRENLPQALDIVRAEYESVP